MICVRLPDLSRSHHGKPTLAGRRIQRWGMVEEWKFRDHLLRLDAGRLRPTVEGPAVADGLAAAFELPGT